MVDTSLSPSNQTYVKRKINTDAFITVSNTSGTFCRVKLAQYDITTDESLLPWQETKNEQYYYVENIQSTKTEIQSSNNIPLASEALATIRIEKSSKKIIVERSYQKLDEMLSYIGGLFGIIVGFLYYLINDYN